MLSIRVASFAEVEAARFPGQDNIYRMAALGPRNFEAAAARVCQILIEDPCWAPMEPDVHYISLRPDFCNIDQVLKRIHDRNAAKSMIDACYDLLIGSGAYSYRRFSERIMDKSIGRCITTLREPGGLSSLRATLKQATSTIYQKRDWARSAAEQRGFGSWIRRPKSVHVVTPRRLNSPRSGKPRRHNWPDYCGRKW